MSILGTYIDKQTVSRVGDNLSGATTLTLAHSLPATNPEQVVPILQSLQSAMLKDPVLFAIGGNASLLTVGVSGNALTTGSFPTISYQVFAQVFYSQIR